MTTVAHTDARRPGGGTSVPDARRESLKRRIRELRARVVRLLWLRAIGLLMIFSVVGIAGAVALDWWLRPSGAAGRWSLSGLLFVGLIGLVAWFIRGIRRRRVSTAVVARQLEWLIPSLGDRLSSAVAIVDPSPLRGASKGASSEADPAESELAAEAVRRAAEELQAARPEQTITAIPAMRMLIVGSLLLVGLLAVGVWRPATASLAARRLLIPTSDAAWPRRNYLELANVPDRVHAGSDLEIFVRDRRGTIPADTEVIVRDAEGNRFTPPLRMSGNSIAAGIENVQADFAVRARGGDDDTLPWQTVEVVAAPQIRSYTVRLSPPEYSGFEPRTLVGEQIRVLSGTEMRIEATVSPPVIAAEFVRVGPQTEESPAEPESWPVEIAASGARIAVGPIALERDGQFVFRWTDAEGLSGQSEQRWRIEVTEDVVPRVAVVQPASDLEISASGSVALEIVAEDDLGLTESWFEIRLPGAPQALRLRAEPHSESPREQTRRVRVRIDQLLDEDPEAAGSERADVSALAAGQTIEVVGVALDTAGQRGESTTRRLRIVSREAIEQALAERQRGAMEPLRQAAREQTVAAEQSEAARGRMLGDAEQRAAAEDRLRAAEAAQSAALRRVREGSQSVVDQLRSAVEMAKDNQIDAAALEALLAAVESATEDSMQPASDTLDRAREQFAEGDAATAARALDDAINRQRQAAEALSAITDQLRRDDARRSAIEQLSELQAAQTRLSEASRQIGGAADSRAEAARLAQQQRALAREAEAMGDRLQQLAEELREQNPQAAAAAAKAADALQRGAADPPQNSAAVADAMRAAAAELERGREGRAGELQSEVTEQIAAARRELSGEGDTANSSTDEENPLRAFAAGVESLRSEQSVLVDALQERADASLSPTQETLADRAEALAVTATAPPGFAEAIADAAEEMRVAAALLRRRGAEASAINSATAALTRLNLIAESLQGAAANRDPQSAENSPPQDAEAETQEPGEANDPVPLSTLRLVRATQDFLRARTEQLAAEEQATAANGGDGAADPLRHARLQAAKRKLAEEQRQLVERIERYAQEMAAARAKQSEETDAPADN